MDSRLDFVIYGASGFTGQYVLKEVARKAQTTKLSWAVAGRSTGKLATALKAAEKELGVSLTNINIITAQTDDFDSLCRMAKQAKVLLNCVGPYRFHGKAVVRACVENSTSHVDIAGEPEYLERMELLYNEEARENGCYVIGACGFDSIPNDMGICFAKQEFQGELASVTSLLAANPGPKGGAFNYGTYQTIVHSLGNWSELTTLRKKFAKVNLPKPQYKEPKRTIWQPLGDGNYYIPFLGADKSIVYRTERDCHLADGSIPLSASFFIKIGPLSNLLKFLVFGALLLVMSMFSFTRSLLLEYPGFFTAGTCYKEGPPADMVADQSFSLILDGKGFSPEAEGRKKPDRKIRVKVTGPDPGYVATSTFLVESAYTVLAEKDKLPNSGGVMTTAFAFKNTSIIERLRKRNVTFDVVEYNKI